MQDGALYGDPLREALVADQFRTLTSLGDRGFQGICGRTGQCGREFFDRSRGESLGVGLRKKFLPALLACLQFCAEFAFSRREGGEALMVALDDQFALCREEREEFVLRRRKTVEQLGEF
jgi:hypothetical protein